MIFDTIMWTIFFYGWRLLRNYVAWKRFCLVFFFSDEWKYLVSYGFWPSLFRGASSFILFASMVWISYKFYVVVVFHVKSKKEFYDDLYQRLLIIVANNQCMLYTKVCACIWTRDTKSESGSEPKKNRIFLQYRRRSGSQSRMSWESGVEVAIQSWKEWYFFHFRGKSRSRNRKCSEAGFVVGSRSRIRSSFEVGGGIGVE